jgi:NhaP-type Na+/H+ or K+/H+ antiporter
VEHADVQALAVVAVGAVVWGLFSARFERWNLTAPIAFLVLGFLAANPPIDLIDVRTSSETVRIVAELTLALVLFSDASRVNVRELRRDAAIPTRLLAIGLPLTIGLGVLAALVVFAGIDPWVAALIAAIVAPTDAALGAPIMENRRIPARVRGFLNVESGLNDGIATPLVTFFIAGAATEVNVAAPSPARAVVDLVAGAVIGAVVGAVGGWLLQLAMAKGWSGVAFRPIAVLGIALFAYAVAVDRDVNGFVAAFVGGMAFGTASSAEEKPALELTADLGSIGAAVVWFIFGALLLTSLEDANWRMVVYAVLSLTVVRMVPVAVSLVGTRLDRATVGIVGWFGPRGLASIVFALIAYDTLSRNEANMVLATATVVVFMSVVLHGVTAAPLGNWYARRARGLHPQGPEHETVAEPLTRGAVRRS